MWAHSKTVEFINLFLYIVQELLNILKNAVCVIFDIVFWA